MIAPQQCPLYHLPALDGRTVEFEAVASRPGGALKKSLSYSTGAGDSPSDARPSPIASWRHADKKKIAMASLALQSHGVSATVTAIYVLVPSGVFRAPALGRCSRIPRGKEQSQAVGHASKRERGQQKSRAVF
jgi:hypothetical protein